MQVARQRGVDEKPLTYIANAYRLAFCGKTSVFDAFRSVFDYI